MGRGTGIVLSGLVVAGLVGVGVWLREGSRQRVALSRPEDRRIEDAQARTPELAPLPEPAPRAGERRAGGARVRVVSSGRAIEGAHVLVHGTELAPLTTDDDGRCALALTLQRTLDLEVTADGYCGLRDEFSWSGEIVVELSPCTVIAGRVLDRATREPVAGARVHVWREKRWVPLSAETVADAEGRFRIECAPLDAGSRLYADVRASARGYPERDERRTVSGELEVLLDARPTFDVHVVEHGSQIPIAAAEVNGWCTDAEGRTQLDWPEDPLALFEINADAAGFCGIAWAAFPDRLPETLVLELPRAAYFEGVVRDGAGRPVAGASVSFDWNGEIESAGLPALPRGSSYWCGDRDATVSDVEGNYRAGPFPPGSGRYEVEVQHPEAGVLRTVAERAGAPGSVTRLDLTLAPLSKGIVEGRVLFNGAVVIPADVWCFDGWDRQLVDPDLDGAYRIEGVAVGAVQLELRSRALEPVRALLPELQVEVRVEAGATTRQDFVFEVPFADVGGHVTYANGEPASRKKIRIEQRESGYDNDDTSGSDGRWTERVPDVGWEYEVELEHGDERLRVTGVRAGDGDVNFVLPATARLPVRVVGADSGAILERVRYTWKMSDGTVRRGSSRKAVESATFVLEVFPATIADLIVEPEDEAYLAGRRGGIELQPGENAPLEIRLERGLELAIEIAPGLEDPRIDREWIFLLEPDRWDSVRAADEPGANPTFSFARGGIPGFDPGAFTDEELSKRLLQFDTGFAHLRGLASGRYRFKAFPAGTTVEPAEVEIPHEGRLVLSWSRGD